ncbi:hypothetical protein SNE35_29750 [Paucibacter sp. R3-3]|uniref:Restriction endonuclease type IV Mrr domain-containing protein n=2 Tax=Roseateles agri TaxID=3098619 RepID=A0ABU5DQX6_9BURK|nr:hypothetical protein [Paucibacter sp. R3-3]
MNNDATRAAFWTAADDWLCDGYSIDVRYFAECAMVGRILQAKIALAPLKPGFDHRFQIRTPNFAVGQAQGYPMKKAALMETLAAALDGRLELPGNSFKLQAIQPLDYFSEMAFRDRWFSPLHMQITGDRTAPLLTSSDLAGIDNALRLATPPFDGLSDASAWLDLPAPGTITPPAINIHGSPPCDLIFEQCTVHDNRIHLILHAIEGFDVDRVRLAVRAVPGLGLDARQQVAARINWSGVEDGLRMGTATIELDRAENVFTMLMIGSSVIRRQWFIDSTKARNSRLLAVRHFDRDLKMIRQGVLEGQDSSKFELGVAALLFLLGFSPAVQLETNAPDIIVATPAGKLVIVECTTRIADFSAKLGKLVDRRGDLTRALAASEHPNVVATVLVCRLPRDQIAAEAEELRRHGTILLTLENLEQAFERVRIPNDPDAMLDNAIAQISGPSGDGVQLQDGSML